MLEKIEEMRTLIDKIKNGVGEDAAKKVEDNFISLTTTMNSLTTNLKEQESELISAKGEAKDKRLALNAYRTESEKKTQEYDDKITELESESNNEETKAEMERLSTFEKETIELQRTDLKSFIENVKDHDRFSKVSNRFKLPSNDDGINFEGFAEMQYNDLKHNLAQMKDLKELEYFDSTPANPITPPPGGKAQRGSDKSYFDRLAEAKTQKELDAVIKAG